MQRVFQRLKPKRVVPFLAVAAMAMIPAVAMATNASAAQASTTPTSEIPESSSVPPGKGISPALTEADAVQTALDYAAERWGNQPRLYECINTGKEKAEEVQWFCYGYFEGGPKTWYVEIGPYGTVIYGERSS